VMSLTASLPRSGWSLRGRLEPRDLIQSHRKGPPFGPPGQRICCAWRGEARAGWRVRLSIRTARSAHLGTASFRSTVVQRLPGGDICLSGGSAGVSRVKLCANPVVGSGLTKGPAPHYSARRTAPPSTGIAAPLI
jgi:hypothetical protein